MAIRDGKVYKGMKWVVSERSRWIVIVTPLAIALAYLGVGIYLARSYSDWKRTDTYSMVAGFFFFLIGTGLAVAHEMRQDAEQTILRQQQVILDALRIDVNAVHKGMQEILRQDVHNLAAADREKIPVPATTVAGPITVMTPPAPETAERPAATAELATTPASHDVELEEAIRATSNDAAVRERLRNSDVLVLGTRAGAIDSDLLHFTADDAGDVEHVYMPIFTRIDVLQSALERNPEWKTLDVMETSGGALLDNRDDDVTLVIDPWSPLEFQIPPDAPGKDDGATKP